MSEESKTNTEGGSFAEPPQEENTTKKTPVPIKPEEETVFTYLKDIIKAIESKEAQLAHHLDRIATALETLVKREQINRAPAPMPTPIPVAPKPVIPPAIQAPTPAPAPTPVSTPTSSFMDSIKAAFPKELADMLVFEDKGNMVTIKPRQYLGSENFAKIASIVRSLNGEYVSAGKESHFRVVPKK